MKFSLDDAGTVTCDVDTLITTRALVQANSGSGKSWLVRRVLEQTHKHVQQLVLDPEGEFSSLREKFDYVHAAAKGGDTIAHPRSAALLAERLLELRASAILDLYELPRHDRIRFTRLFLEALMDSPKKLWHPVIVVIDEAHTFAPEKGSAESLAAVIDLSSRGRKRGFCPLLATQRIAKLHKDAAAECNNRLIGRTGLDIDLQRASDELGFKKERWRELKELTPGEFFVSGPAFNVSGVGKVKVGKVLTTHPEAGKRIAFKAPPPTSKIKALLPKLSDLPAEAEEQKKTVEQLRGEVSRLQRELASQPKIPTPVPPPTPKLVEVPVVPPAVMQQFERSRDELMAALDEVKAGLKKAQAMKMLATTTLPVKISSEPIRRNGYIVEPGGKVYSRDPLAPKRRSAATGADWPFGDGERAILIAIAQQGDVGATREQASILSGYKMSTRNAYISRLNVAGLVESMSNGNVRATAAGIEALGSDFEPLPTGDALREFWLSKLPDGERALFEVLVEEYPNAVSRDELSSRTEYKPSTRNAYLSRLSVRKLVCPNRDGTVVASHLLFEQ